MNTPATRRRSGANYVQSSRYYREYEDKQVSVADLKKALETASGSERSIIRTLKQALHLLD